MPMSLVLIKLMPKKKKEKRRHDLSWAYTYMLTTRCLNNIIDTFMRGYSSLALTSPSSLTNQKKNKKTKKPKKKKRKKGKRKNQRIRNTSERRQE